MHPFHQGKNLPDLNIPYSDCRIKQYHMVQCLDCCLEADLSEESIAV